MRDFIKAVVVIVVLVGLVYIVLPQDMKDMLRAEIEIATDSTTKENVLAIQNAPLLGHKDVTYVDAVRGMVANPTWTYENKVDDKGKVRETVTVTGTKASFTFEGNNETGGFYSSCRLTMVFLLDGKGGYQLVTYIDGQEQSDARKQMIVDQLYSHYNEVKAK